MLFDLTFPCYLTTFSGKKCLSGEGYLPFFLSRLSKFSCVCFYIVNGRRTTFDDEKRGLSRRLTAQVKLSKGVRGHWPLLKSRLKKICNMDGAVLPLWSTRPAAESFGPPFLLSVSSYDRQGFLHGTPPSPLPPLSCHLIYKGKS
jgi:hypothetical protein